MYHLIFFLTTFYFSIFIYLSRSRSDPFSRGPSHDRDLSLTPAEHLQQQQYQQEQHQQLSPAVLNDSFATTATKHDSYQVIER